LRLKELTPLMILPAAGGALLLAPATKDRDDFANEQLAALVATAVDGVICITEKGLIELFNPACEKIFGYVMAEVLGKNVQMLVPQKYGQHDRYIEAYLTTGEKRVIGVGRDVDGQRKNGEIFPMRLSVGEFSHQGVRYFVGVVQDLSDRVAESRRLRELEERVVRLGQIAAVVEMGSAIANEVNQPLAAMTLYLAAAERALGSDSDKAAALCALSRAEALRVGEALRRVREMINRTEQAKRWFSLAAAIEAAIELCRLTCVTQNCAIEWAEPPPDLTIFGHEDHIRHVLINLIKNAIDATEGQAARLVKISVRVGELVEIFVMDNGPGVAPAMRPRLFAHFATSKPGGLGVGLSSARSIAEAHGGELQLVEEGALQQGLSGACFRLALPFAATDD
jgi:two-component system sensor kinase FixL